MSRVVLLLSVIFSISVSAQVNEEDLFPAVAPSAEEVLNTILSSAKGYFRDLVVKKANYSFEDRQTFFGVNGCGSSGELNVTTYDFGVEESEDEFSLRQVFEIHCDDGVRLSLTIDKTSPFEIKLIPVKEFLELNWGELKGLTSMSLAASGRRMESFLWSYEATSEVEEDKRAKTWLMKLEVSEESRPWLSVLQTEPTEGDFIRAYYSQPNIDRVASVLSQSTNHGVLRQMTFTTRRSSDGLPPVEFQQYLQDQVLVNLGFYLWVEERSLPNLDR